MKAKKSVSLEAKIKCSAGSSDKPGVLVLLNFANTSTVVQHVITRPGCTREGNFVEDVHGS